MKEFWKVELQDKKYSGERQTYYVFATSAATAEDKALKIARKENPDLKQLYCKSAEFVGYIAG